MVGGLDEQPRQLLSLQEEDLKPLLTFFNRRLLLTSASDSGAFILPLPLFLGVTGPFVALSPLSPRFRSCSSSNGSKTTAEEGSKFEHVERITDGHEEGSEKRVDLQLVANNLEPKKDQALDWRKSFAQSKVGHYNKRMEKKFIQASGIRTVVELVEGPEK